MNANCPRAVLLILLLAVLLVMPACAAPAAPPAASTAVPAPTASSSPAPTVTPTGFEATLQAAGVIETRAPVATATPGRLADAVDQTVNRMGLQDVTFLGLSSSDWLNLFISVIFVAAGFGLGSWLVHVIRKRVAPLLHTEGAEARLVTAAGSLRWLVALLALYLGTLRLGFISAETKELLRLFYLLLAVALITRALWQVLDLAEAELRYRLHQQNREQELDPALILVKRLARIGLLLFAFGAILSLFGINLTAFAALLGIGGLAFSLAARSTIEDGIAGAIILTDRPFRVGDRIEVAAANTWGDVMEIGLRTTRVRTRDNRLVIIPNSVIVGNEVINYTYPDPTYRIETLVDVDYATDIALAKMVLETAVRSVPDVLADRPVDILYSEMGDSAIILRVRWWIQTYADTRRVTDKVHVAIHKALEEAQIVSPFPTQTLLIHNLGADEDKKPG